MSPERATGVCFRDTQAAACGKELVDGPGSDGLRVIGQQPSAVVEGVHGCVWL